MARKSTISPISKFGEVLKEYLDSQDMTYKDLELKLGLGFCGKIQQWVTGIPTGKGRKSAYPDAVNLKALSNAIPPMWFEMLWDAIPTQRSKEE